MIGWQSTHTHNMTPANYDISLLFECDIRQFSRLAAMCTHEQCKRSDYNEVILVHVDVKHTLETCDDSVLKDNRLLF